MKAYTDLSQSKKLAEILPIESADMKWFVPADNEGEFIEKVSLITYKSEYTLFDKVTDWNDTPYLPCWSLAALLKELPDTMLGKDKDGYVVMVETMGSGLTAFASNPIDACYEMIIKIHEQKLL